MKRLILAMLVAPLWAPLILGFYGWFYWPVPEIFPEMSHAEWVGTMIAATTALGYTAMIVVGLPVHMILRYMRYGSLAAYLLSWAVCSFIFWVCGFLIMYYNWGWAFSSSYMMETISQRPHVPTLSGLFGMLIGATFWLIVGPRRRSSNPVHT